MKKEIKSGIIMAMSFAFTLGLIGVTYAAFINISEVNSGGVLTASLMNNIINNQKDLESRVNSSSVPSGFVGAFNLTTCPTGWTEADGTNSTPDLRGAFVRGMNGSVNGRDVVRALGNYQEDEINSHLHSVNPPSTTSANQSANHSHPIDPPNTTSTSDGIHSHSVTNGNTGFQLGTTTSGFQTATMGRTHQGIGIANSAAHAHYLDIGSFNSGNESSVHTHATDIPAFNSANTGGTETRPKNVALLYCVKN